MSSIEERVCVGCRATEETVSLERCTVCARWFCGDCAQRATGRRFCSAECARAYFWGDQDDDREDVDDAE